MDKLKMALIGAGTWGRAHAEIYSSYHLSKFVAVCDVSEDKAKTLAQEYDVKYFTDYEDEASHPDVICKPRIHGKPTGLAYESIRNFIERIYHQEKVLISLEESVAVTKIILTIMESAKKKEPVRVVY